VQKKKKKKKKINNFHKTPTKTPITPPKPPHFPIKKPDFHIKISISSHILRSGPRDRRLHNRKDKHNRPNAAKQMIPVFRSENGRFISENGGEMGEKRNFLGEIGLKFDGI
jgi:hypothetical protein